MNVPWDLKAKIVKLISAPALLSHVFMQPSVSMMGMILIAFVQRDSLARNVVKISELAQSKIHVKMEELVTTREQVTPVLANQVSLEKIVKRM